MFIAAPYTGHAGEYVTLAETLAGCAAIIGGQADNVPEAAFARVGTLDQAIAKAKRLDLGSLAR